MQLIQQNLPMTLAELSRHSLLIVTKLSLLRLRRRQHRMVPQVAEAAARCGRDLRATAAG